MAKTKIKPPYEIAVRSVTVGRKTMRLPPSLNARMHWRVRAKWTKAFRWETKIAALEQKIPRMERAQITLINFTYQPKDIDNLYGSAKPIIDGLIDARILSDDATKFLDLKCMNKIVHTRAAQRVVVIIHPLQKTKPV